MPHTINIPDPLWDLYDGSPSAMRDTLWQAKVSAPPSVESDEEEFHPGTVINLRWSTRCSVCRKRLLKGEQAVIRESTRGTTEIVCLDHVRDQLRMDLAGISDELGGL
jgi:hypothetical protein